MLEIIGLVYLTRHIGEIAFAKGEKIGKWKAYAVLAWFLGEFLTFFIGGAFLGENASTLVLLPFAYAGAYFGYWLVKRQLEQKEGSDNSLEAKIEEIGNNS